MRPSWKITDAYRKRVAALRHSAAAAARQTWAAIDPQQLSSSYNPGMLALTLTVLQREGARLSGGYLKAFIDAELGLDTPLPLVDARQVGSARNGTDLRKTLDSPLVGVKTRIKNGADPRDALTVERASVVRIAGLAVDTAARDSLAKAMAASPHVVGWQRATSGACAACLAVANRSHDLTVDFPVHPNCSCVQEPIVDGAPPGGLRPTGREMFDAMPRSQQDDVLGPEIAQAVRDGRLAFEDVAQRVPMATEPDFITTTTASAVDA
jgi:hypothetical protein